MLELSNVLQTLFFRSSYRRTIQRHISKAVEYIAELSNSHWSIIVNVWNRKIVGNTESRMMISLLLILILNISLANLSISARVSADQIFAAQTGGSFSRSREPKYDIVFHSEKSPYFPDEEQESIIMPGKNGQKFLCYLPKVEKPMNEVPVAQNSTSTMIMEAEKRTRLKTPDELLVALKDLCFVRQEGWWSYEFCYQKNLRQLHLENEKVVQEFVLGVYDAEATANQNFSDASSLKDPRSKDASQRYHAHLYTNGTTCDLTNQPRETEVRFVCSEPRVMISSITEISTCKYALTVQGPMLCKHPLFIEERPVLETINCNPLTKDNKETKVEEENFKEKQIVMVTDDSIINTEERA